VPVAMAAEDRRKYELRRVVDALLYVVKTGCQWRQLPDNFPPWLSVHQQFRAWRDDGTWERVNQALREQGRKAGGRSLTPTVAIVDSQTAKTAPKGGQRGYDAGKKIKGRKRHIAVDSEGNLLAVLVHSAGIQDRVAARAVLMRLFHRIDTVTTVFADGGYTGTLIDWLGRCSATEWRSSSATSNTPSRSCRSDGSLNAPSPGSPGHADLPRTMNSDTPQPKP
jgi:putative transposase